MLPRKKRLGTKLLGIVLEKGVSYYSPLLSFRVYKTTSEPSRFAVSVSKKISKSAVVRNKIKRIIYTCIRKSLSKEESFGFWGLFSVKNNKVLLNKETLYLEIQKLLKDSHVM